MESTIYTVGGKRFELKHHGVKGMKWGVRRYQNKDGTLTPAGKRRKAKDEYRSKLNAAGKQLEADGARLKREGKITNWRDVDKKASMEAVSRYSKAEDAARKEYRTKMREIDAEDHRTAKRVATALLMTATAAAAVAYYRKNPEAVKSVLSKVGNTTVSAAKKAGNKTYEAGKKYVQDAIKGAKEGIAEGIREAPKKAAKTIVTGAAMMAAKRMLDATVGKEEAARIFQANNNKKIGSFWKVSPDDRDDD